MSFVLLVAGVIAALAALGVVLSRQILYSALCLVLNVAMLAVMFLVLNAQFLFAVQLIVYAGAVMVLFVFIIALLSPGSEDRPVLDGKLIIGVLGVLVITGTVLFTGLNSHLVQHENGQAYLRGQVVGRADDPYHSFSFNESAVNQRAGPHDVADRGNVQAVGGQLFTTFLLPFEITSLLLFVAAIGAVYLTRRQKRTSQQTT